MSGNVLTNDSDPDGNPLSASLVSGPSHGTLSLLGTGAFTYTPAANYHGTGLVHLRRVRRDVEHERDGDHHGRVRRRSAGRRRRHRRGEPTRVRGHPGAGATTPTSTVRTSPPPNIAAISPAGATATVNADGTVRYTAPGELHRPGIVHLPGVGRDPELQHRDRERDGLPGDLQQRHRHRTRDGSTVGSFTRLDDSFNCKRYTLDGDRGRRHRPVPADRRGLRRLPRLRLVRGRPVVHAGRSRRAEPELRPRPAAPRSGRCSGASRRSSTAATRSPRATIPSGETWCIASAATEPNATGVPVTTFQVFGHDDPRFH